MGHASDWPLRGKPGTYPLTSIPHRWSGALGHFWAALLLADQAPRTLESPQVERLRGTGPDGEWSAPGNCAPQVRVSAELAQETWGVYLELLQWSALTGGPPAPHFPAISPIHTPEGTQRASQEVTLA